MQSRRTLLRAVGSACTVGVAGCAGTEGSGDDGSTTSETPDGSTEDETMSTFEFTTTAFDDGDTIPERFTKDGADVSPPLSISGVPAEANALAVVVDDPDAPSGTFTHWLLWNVSPQTTAIPEDVPDGETVDTIAGARQGTNDFGNVGYDGPKPPKGDGPHTYRFVCTALDSTLDVPAGAKAEEVAAAIGRAKIGTASFTGEYER